MKYSQSRSILVMSVIISGSLLLGACSQEGTFRNRNFDYLRTDVQQLPAVKTPPDVPAPKTTSYLTIPPGQDNYTPTTQATVNLTPPGIDTVMPIPATSTKTEAQQTAPAQPGATTASAAPAIISTSSAATGSVAAPLAAANNTFDSALSAAPVKSPLAIPTAPVATQAKAQTTAPLSSQPIAQPSSTVAGAAPVKSHWFTPNPIPASQLNATANPQNAKSGTAGFAQEGAQIPSGQPSLSFNSNNQGIITVNAPYTSTWQRVGQALASSNFMVTDKDAQKGFYFVAAKNLPSADHTYMVSITQNGQTNQIQIYDMTAQLATSFEASDLLKAIDAALSQ